MIDIQRPITEEGVRPKKIPNEFKKRIIAALALALLMVGVIYVAWLFLSDTRTVRLAEGQAFVLNDYTIRISRVMDTICPGIPEVECTEQDNKLGAQFQVQNNNSGFASYGYLGLGGSEIIEVQGLRLQLVSVDTDEKTVKLKITQK